MNKLLDILLTDKRFTKCINRDLLMKYSCRYDMIHKFIDINMIRKLLSEYENFEILDVLVTNNILRTKVLLEDSIYDNNINNFKYLLENHKPINLNVKLLTDIIRRRRLKILKIILNYYSLSPEYIIHIYTNLIKSPNYEICEYLLEKNLIPSVNSIRYCIDRLLDKMFQQPNFGFYIVNGLDFNYYMNIYFDIQIESLKILKLWLNYFSMNLTFYKSSQYQQACQQNNAPQIQEWLDNRCKFITKRIKSANY